MSEKNIVVPEGMLEAVADADKALHEPWGPVPQDRWGRSRRAILSHALEAALRWLADNPIVPSRAQVDRMVADGTWNGTWMAVEWQRRMFLAQEPHIPKEVMDLLCDPGNAGRGLRFDDMADKVNDIIIEAFCRGRALSQNEK